MVASLRARPLINMHYRDAHFTIAWHIGLPDHSAGEFSMRVTWSECNELFVSRYRCGQLYMIRACMRKMRSATPSTMQCTSVSSSRIIRCGDIEGSITINFASSDCTVTEVWPAAAEHWIYSCDIRIALSRRVRYR